MKGDWGEGQSGAEEGQEAQPSVGNVLPLP